MDAVDRSKLRDFIKAELARGQANVDIDTAPLVDIGIIDSLGIMKLVQFLEKEFGVLVSDDQLVPENFENLGAIEKLVGTQKK
jgi:acyl carrier protein